MTVLRYYIVSNIFLVFCWIVYVFILKRRTGFLQQRIFLLLSIILSLSFPLIQSTLSEWITLLWKEESLFVNRLQSVVYVFTNMQAKEQAGSASGSQPLSHLPFSAGMLFSMIVYSIQFFRLHQIIHRSVEFLPRKGSYRLFRSGDAEVPFVFCNRIVIPDDLSNGDEEIAIRHERFHLQLKHQWDIFLYSLSTSVFYLNPVFYLLKKAIIQVHEYQVDRRMIEGEMDVTEYLLTLIKLSVGKQKFALAAGLSGSSLKKRIMMINNKKKERGYRRLVLSVPLLLFGSLLISVACTDRNDKADNAEQLVPEITQIDSFVVEIIETPGDKIQVQNDNVLLVLMNFNSLLLIEGEKANLDEAEEMILKAYEEIMFLNVPFSEETTNTEQYERVTIVFQHDKETSVNNIANFHSIMSHCFMKLQSSFAYKIYKKPFNELSAEQKDNIRDLIPAKIYQIKPDKNISH